MSEYRKFAVLAATTLAMLITLVYHGVLSHGFVTFDDNLHLTANPWFNPISFSGIMRFWTSPYENLYIPVSYTFFGIETILSDACLGRDASGSIAPQLFKLSSLTLHFGCAILVFALLLMLRLTFVGALIGASLFAVHPLQVESVAWTSETRGLLAAFLGLSALLIHLHSGHSTSVDAVIQPAFKRSVSRQMMSTSLLTLALLSKPSAASIVLICGILEIGVFKRHWRPVLRGLVPWITCVLLIGVLSRQLQSGDQLSAQVPLLSRLYVFIDAMGFYFTRLFLPVNLTADYGRSPQVVLDFSEWYFALLGILGGLLCWWGGHASDLRLASLVFVAGLAPTLGLIPFAFQEVSTVADRYTYLAMLGPAIGIAMIWNVSQSRKIRAVIIVCGLTLAIIANRQVDVWQNSETLYDHMLAVNPQSWLALNNSGDLLAGQGRYKQAEERFRKAIDIRPEYPTAWRNLGVCAGQNGDLSEALEHFRRAVQLAPYNVQCLWSAAKACQNLEIFNESKAHYEIAVELAPHNSNLWSDYGILLASLNEHQDAVDAYRQALKIAVDDWRIRTNLAHSLLQLGLVNQARREYQHALQLNPQIPEAKLNLGLLASKQGDTRKAIKLLEELLSSKEVIIDEELLKTAQQELAALYSLQGIAALEQRDATTAHKILSHSLKLDPESVAAHFHLARLYQMTKQPQEAIQHLQRVLTLVPPGSQAAKDTQALLDQLQTSK